MKQQLTAKDLTVLSELMNVEQNLYKQCLYNAECYEDQSTAKLARDIACKHRDNFNALYTLIS